MQKIEEINNVINGIASQTNILALNAAVEAARADKQGLGFAVVASEVRHLATRSSEAAKEISTLISQSTRSINNDGAKIIVQAGKNMDEIVFSTSQVNDFMQEISMASEEQNAGVNQIAVAINQMDMVTQQNASLVEQSAITADNLNTHSKKLFELVSAFRLNKDERTRA